MKHMRQRILVQTTFVIMLLVLVGSVSLAQEGGPITSSGQSASPNAIAVAVDTSFTYQGSLLDKGTPVNNTCDFVFSLYDDATFGKLVGTNTRNGVSVEDGIFTVSLDYGTGAFEGDARWLQIEVDCGHTGSETLSPRQPLTATPYALGLRPGATVAGATSSPALTLDNTTGHGLQTSSDNADGVFIGYAGSVGVAVESSGSYGVNVGTAGSDGVRVGSAINGFNVFQASGDGLYVTHAGDDGVFVCHTGTLTDCAGYGSTDNNGVEIARAEHDGVFVDSAGHEGVQVDSAGRAGIYVGSAGEAGLYVNSAGSNGVYVHQSINDGFRVCGAGSVGVCSESTGNHGVEIDSAENSGVYVDSAGDDGLFVCSTGAENDCTASIDNHGVEIATADASGVYVGSADEFGVYVNSSGNDGFKVMTAGSPSGTALLGSNIHNGVEVNGASGNGLFVGVADDNGVYVFNSGEDGILVKEAGTQATQVASALNNGLEIQGSQGDGIYIGNTGTNGVTINSAGDSGVYVGYATGVGVYVADAGIKAAHFIGDVQIVGDLTKSSSTFKIDHPLDPENQYLSHSVVESPDMMNIYNGNVALDNQGEALVELPDWFGALNRDFRYQLTAIEAPGPNLYIAEEVKGNRFKIAGGESGMKVSWQVTGIRHDPYAEMNRILVEESKPADEQGTYLHPDAYGLPESRGLAYKEAQVMGGER